MKNSTVDIAFLKAKQYEIHEKIRQLAKQNYAKDKNVCAVLDGVGDIEGYLLSNPKIMWILRGPYNSETPQCEEYNEYEIWDCWDISSHDLPCWVPLISILKAVRHRLEKRERIELCDMSPIDKSDLSEFKKTAYINICKINYDHTIGVEKPSEIWKDIVREQIALYNPDVIIFGGTYDIFRKREGYYKSNVFLEHTPTEGIAHIYKDPNGKILFNAYHPSYVGGFRKDLLDWYVDEIADRIYIYNINQINELPNKK